MTQSIPNDPLVVPNGFTLEEVTNPDFNARITAIPEFKVKEPIEVKVSEAVPGFLAYVRIPRLSYFISGRGATREQAAYRMFLKMEKIRQMSEVTTSLLETFTPSSLEAVASRYEPQY